MGRTIPMEEITQVEHRISIILTFIWMVALVATISGLCGLWPKKTSKSSNTDAENATKEGDINTTNPQQAESQLQANAYGTNTNDDDQFSRPLPPPPSATRLELGDLPVGKLKPKIDKTSSLQNYMSKTTSARKLTSSISMRMSMKIKDKASEFKGKVSEVKDKASDLTDLRKKHENESLWTKRIILGEKCRLPNQDDEVTSYDVQGNKVVTCPPTKTRQSPSLSRSCSSIDHRATSSIAIQGAKLNDNGKGKRKLLDDDDDDDDDHNDNNDTSSCS